MHELVREYKVLVKCSVDYFLSTYHSEEWYECFSKNQGDDMVDELVILKHTPEIKQYRVKNNQKVVVFLSNMLQKINISTSEMTDTYLNILINANTKKITHQIIPPVCKDRFKIEYVIDLNAIDEIQNCCELTVSAKVKYQSKVMKPVALWAKKKIKKYVLGDVPKNILELSTTLSK